MAVPSDSPDQGIEDSAAGQRDADGADEDEAVPRPPRKSGRPAVNTKRAIDRLDPRERRFSFAAAGGALLFGTMIYLLETQDHFHFSKSPDAPLTTLVLGIVCGGLLLAATYIGRRAPVGFVALFTFLIFGTSALFLGAPFLALAVWLLFRSYKIQRDTAAEARAARTREAASTSKSSTTRAASGSAKSSRPAARNRTGRGPSSPEANKRYTPKRPPPPAPKPSRRERKAAKTD